MSDLSHATGAALRVGAMMMVSLAIPAAPAIADDLKLADLKLALPVACEIGRDCFVQNFFDHDAGPDRAITPAAG